MNTKSSLAALLLYFFAAVTAQAQGVKAEKFALETARRFMLGIHPKTGNSPGAYVYNWEFDAQRQRYTIKLNLTWRARKCFLCFEEAVFEVAGFLEVGRDGSRPIFTETYRNEAVREAWGKGDLSNLLGKDPL